MSKEIEACDLKMGAKKKKVTNVTANNNRTGRTEVLEISESTNQKGNSVKEIMCRHTISLTAVKAMNSSVERTEHMY